MGSVIIAAIIDLFKLIYHLLAAFVCLFVPSRRKDVSNDVVLVTGAGSGIGRALSLKFAGLGATVVLWDINKSANDAVAEEINSKTPNKAFSYKCDCTKKDEVYKVAEQVKKDVGDVTILINNAGVVSGKKLQDLPDDKIELTFQVNSIAHFWTIKAFLPAMMEKNHGHIVTIASGAGLFGVDGLVDYCASKHAAVGLHTSLTAELYAQKHNSIHTTCICPAYIDTGMFAGVRTNPLMMPLLTVDYATDRMVTAVLTNQYILMMPRILYLAYYLQSFLPLPVLLIINKWTGALHSMNTFTGRQKQE